MTQFTQREFLFLDDLMEAEHLAALKARSASQQAADPQVRQLFTQLAASHEAHFTTLLRYLEQRQTASSGAWNQQSTSQTQWQQQQQPWQTPSQAPEWQAQGSYPASQFAPQNVTQPVSQRSAGFTQ